MRHVVAALPRQASARRKVPERRVRGARQGAVDPTLARIVRRDRERPVAVVPVEEAKVARRRTRRARGVGPVVALRVDDQAEAPRRRGAELPEAELAESAARLRLEPTFDRREQRQRWRQPGIGHELAELRQVARAAGHGLARVLGEVPSHPSLPGVHERLIDARQRRTHGLTR